MASNSRCLPTWCAAPLRRLPSRRGGAALPPDVASTWPVRGGRRAVGLDVTSWFMTLSWASLLASVFLIYLAIAAAFFGLYAATADPLAAPDQPPASAADTWWYALSVLLTGEGGAVAPASPAGRVLTAAQQFASLILNALLIGLIVAKASLPLSKLVFSGVAVVQPRNGVPHFIFRVAHSRGHFLLNADVRMHYFRRVTTSEGETTFLGRPLAFATPPVLAPAAAVAHEIDAASPLHGLTPEAMAAEAGHVVVCVSSVDNQVAETTHARHVYRAGDVLWGRRFVDALSYAEGAATPTVEMGRLEETVEAPLARAKGAALRAQGSGAGEGGRPRRQHNAELFAGDILKSVASKK